MKRTLILGGPGAGKTERLLRVMEKAIDSGVSPAAIAFVTFTNAAADEAAARATRKFKLSDDELPYFRTIHSLCFRELALHRHSVVQPAHLQELAELTGELAPEELDFDAPARGLGANPLLTVDHYARTTMQSLEGAWHDHGRELDWHRLKRFCDAYRLFKLDMGLLDFTDMLERYLQEGTPVPVRVAIVDEAQDLTRLQWAVVDKAFANAEQLWVAGDDDQCQPGNTVVETTTGPVRMDALDPKNHAIISYARCDAAIYRRGYSFKKSQHAYSGNLYTVRAAGRMTEATANHRWLVKWTPEVKHGDLYGIYLMKKGNRFRIGWTKLFRDKGVFHLTARSNSEDADAVWLLKVVRGKKHAYAYEQIIAIKYGIPQLPFRPAHDNRCLNQRIINTVYRAAPGTAGGRAALRDHGLLESHPFIDRRKPNYSRYGATIMEVVSCNLQDGLMLVPVHCGGTKYTWEKITVTKRPVAGLSVYGLDVEKYHTYIANGIIAHNSVHHWAGADEDRLLKLDYEREILPLSHRLPRAVFDLSQEIAARIGRRYAKVQASSGRPGSVDWVSRSEEVDLATGTWLLLARTRYQLRDMVEAARDQGVVYKVHGESSIDPEHVRAIQAYERLRAAREPLGGADAVCVMRALARVAPVEIEEEGLYGAGDLGVDVSRIWHDALVGISLIDREYYLTCLRRGEKLTNEPRVRIETIHGAKGAEAQNVLLKTDLSYKTHRGFELDPDSEHRVFYVGVTRAMEHLHLVAPQTQYGYRL